MYYKQSRSSELSKREMELARRAFRGKLLRHRFSPSFVISNSDELLGKAHGDFARALARGVEVADPVGFTVHCAWRHTQNLLRSEDRAPASVSTEKAAEIADTELPPDELVLASDRSQKIQEAIAKLNENQRKVIALTFFEEMSWREAAKHLGWTPSKVQHHYEKAMEHMRRFLAVKSSDELVIDLGMAAWVSCAGASAHNFPAGFEAMLDKASDGATSLWGRAHDLARRLTPSGGGGGEQVGVFASSGGGRALGTCASVAVACIVGGAAVVGPGLPGSHPARAEDRPPQSSAARQHRGAAPSPLASSSAVNVSSEPDPEGSASKSKQVAAAGSGAMKESAAQAETQRVKAQTSGIARAGAESSESSSTPTASSSGSGAEPEAVTVTSAPSSSASPQEESSAQTQFGAFK